MSAKTGTIIDRLGACASTICAVHCLLTGLAMGFLAVVGLGFMGSPIFEFSFVAVAVVVGGWAVFHGIKRHHSRIPAFVFVLGLASIVGSHFVGHAHEGEVSGFPWGTALAVAGGLLIASFHFVNARMQHKGCSCAKHGPVDRAGHPV